MPEWLGRQAAIYPNRPALVAGPVRWTFGEMDRAVTRAARQLASLGVTEGSRVAVLLPNSAPFAVMTHALVRLGAVMVPLNVRLAPPELAWQLADASAEVLLSDPELAPRAQEAGQRLPTLMHIIAGDVNPGDAARAPEVAQDPEIATLGRLLAAAPEADVPLRDAIDLASVQGIIYTSATSGRPKGVLLTYGNHWWSAIGSALRLGLRDDDRWLAPLPLYHVGGLAILWRSVVYGIPAVLHDTFDPVAVNREIDGGGVTFVSVVSTMLERMLEARAMRPFPPSLRCILLGGGPASPALLATCAQHGVPVAPTYGLTETASQVATLAPGEAARKPGSSGQALLPTLVRIDLDGRAAAAGEVGEILVGGPTVMLGYAGRPDESTRVLRDGWLHTGDLGHLDDEGHLFVVDRRDDLIVTGGENVYPAEVEAVLCEHPMIADAGVIGLPDPTWGYTVVAVVTVRPGAPTGAEEITRFCAGRLARYKVPRRIWFRDTLPRSGAGKLLRRAIRTWATEEADREGCGTPAGGAPLGSTPVGGTPTG